MLVADRNDRFILGCLLTVFLCRAAFACVIVPPWQGPDEPNHVALAWLLAAPYDPTGTASRAMERAVLESMAHHRWWELYGDPTPNPLPTTFENMAAQIGVGTYSQPLYYGLAAALLRVTRPTNVEAAYWHLRSLSIVLVAMAVMLGWSGTRLLFDPVTTMGATAVAVLHPQFLLTALTVNPDALVILCGAIIWWQSAGILTRRRPAFSSALVLVAAVAALLTKRSAVPIAAAGAIVVLSVAVVRARDWQRRRVVRAAAMAGAASVLLAVWLLPFKQSWTDLAEFWTSAVGDRRDVGVPGETTLGAILRIVPTSVDNAWLVAGWGRFPAPLPWIWLARILTTTGLAGAVGRLVRCPSVRPQLGLAIVLVGFQVAGVYTTAFLNVIVPEGRLLFAAFIPAAVLIWTGLAWLMPAALQRHGAVVTLSVLAALDLTAFATVLVPTYLP